MLGNRLYRKVIEYLDERRRSRPRPVVHPVETRVTISRSRAAARR